MNSKILSVVIPCYNSQNYMAHCIESLLSAENDKSYIGREDQSVNEKIMISRIDQQLKVNQLMIDHILHSSVFNRKLKLYMCHYLEIIMTVSSILLVRSRQNEHLGERERLWHSVKDRDKNLYLRLPFSLLGTFSNLPEVIGRKITIALYKLSQEFAGFNLYMKIVKEC